MSDPANQPGNQPGNQSENQPDLSLTVWAKTLTPQQRAALRQPYGTTPAEWLATLVAERDAGNLVLPPPDRVAKQIGRLVTVEDIQGWLVGEATRGGFTFFARFGDDGEPIAPTKGSAVAMGGTELKNRRAELLGDDEEAALLRRLRWTAWSDDLETLWKEVGACAGGWYDPDTGEFEVSLTIVILSQEEAERFGLQQDQKAIFRFADEVIIFIGGSGVPEWMPRGARRED